MNLGFGNFPCLITGDGLVLDLQQLQNKNEKTKSIQKKLFQILDEFVNYGGYPVVVLENNIE